MHKSGITAAYLGFQLELQDVKVLNPECRMKNWFAYSAALKHAPRCGSGLIRTWHGLLI